MEGNAASKFSVLPPAICQAEIPFYEEGYPIDAVKLTLLNISMNLVAIDTNSVLWKSEKPLSWKISLAMLLDRLETGKLSPSPLRPSVQNANAAAAAAGGINPHNNNNTNNTHNTSHYNTNHPHYHHPSPLTPAPTLAMTRTGKSAKNRPLEDFEDLYYSSLASIRDMHHHLRIRLDNNFAQPSTPVCTLVITETHANHVFTIADTLPLLHAHWVTLNNPLLVKPLDAAIRRARVKCMHLELIQRGGGSDAGAMDDVAETLYGEEEYAEMPGLAWVGGWASSMIAAWMEERYRGVLPPAPPVQEEQQEQQQQQQRAQSQDQNQHQRGHRDEAGPPPVQQPTFNDAGPFKQPTFDEACDAVRRSLIRGGGGEAQHQHDYDYETMKRKRQTEGFLDQQHQLREEQLRTAGEALARRWGTQKDNAEWAMRAERVRSYQDYLWTMVNRHEGGAVGGAARAPVGVWGGGGGGSGSVGGSSVVCGTSGGRGGAAAPGMAGRMSWDFV